MATMNGRTGHHIPRLVVLLILASLAPVTRADAPSTQPASPITVRSEVRASPPLRCWFATIDLADPRVHVRVARGGDDPDGDGPWETTLLSVPDIARRDGAALAINAAFFQTDVPASSQEKYAAHAPARSIGVTMTDGVLWSRSPLVGRPALVVLGSGRVSIQGVWPIPNDARQVVTGNAFLVRDGRVVADLDRNQRHPRTAIGIDAAGHTLAIAIVDGRRPWTVGMTSGELADEMVRLGCHAAFNLDGGGSTTLVQRDPQTGDYNILNQPSDVRPRPVANAICIDLSQ
jgi:exopolysaccharide biosynthesis protein